jgi:hypothetical protein
MTTVPTSTPASEVAASEADEHHDGRILGDRLDRSFVAAWAKGYVLGLFVFGAFVFATVRFVGDQAVGVSLAIALAVSFWVSLLAAVVFVGLWTMRNEEELFGHGGRSPH